MVYTELLKSKEEKLKSSIRDVYIDCILDGYELIFKRNTCFRQDHYHYRALILFQDGSISHFYVDDISTYKHVRQAINEKKAIDVYKNSVYFIINTVDQEWLVEQCKELQIDISHYFKELYKETSLLGYLRSGQPESYYVLMEKYLRHLLKNIEEKCKEEFNWAFKKYQCV